MYENEEEKKLKIRKIIVIRSFKNFCEFFVANRNITLDRIKNVRL
jgi:hypothetical protein